MEVEAEESNAFEDIESPATDRDDDFEPDVSYYQAQHNHTDAFVEEADHQQGCED